MEKTNSYFNNLYETGCAFEARRAAHKEKKQSIIDTFGWDSPELKAWYDEYNAMKFPISDGACKAFRAWKKSVSKDDDEVVVEDFCWDREVADFLNTFREAGIKSFVYVNQSTAVMENLHAFVANGCTMLGLYTITRKENLYGSEESVEIPGIRFTID